MARHQIVLFADTLEDRIAQDHPVRILDELLDRTDWTEWEAKYNGTKGQPPIHPSVLAKVLLFSMIRRIRSSRQIEYNLTHSIDFIWLTSGRTIDHVTISNFRRAHPTELKGLYRQMVKVAMDLGLAKLSEICIDGTRVLANANKYKTWTAERIGKVIADLDAQITKAMSEQDANDELDELFDDGTSADKLPESLSSMRQRKEELDKLQSTLTEMDQTRAKSGIAPKTPAQIPKTDPDSRILPNKEGGYAPNYTPMAVAETCNGFIVGADVLIGNVEHDQLAPLVAMVSQDFGVKVERVMADGAYTTGPNLTKMEEALVELLGPLREQKCDTNPAHRDILSEPVADSELSKLPINPATKCFDRQAFVYEESSDCYYCPAGKQVVHRGTEQLPRGGEKVACEVYVCPDCKGCSLASRCRPNPNAKVGRRIIVDPHEAARCRHRDRMDTEEAKASYKRRQHIGETPFAILKAVFGLRQFLLRGIDGVQIEWLWGCTAFNVKKLMKLIAEARRELSDNDQVAIA